MAVKLADAFVQITASMEGTQKQIARELAGLGKVGESAGKDISKAMSSEVEKAGKSFEKSGKAAGNSYGSQFAKEAQSSLGGLGDRIMGGIGKGMLAGAAAAGTAVAGTLGAAIGKGFSRLTNIDQAESKLRGLGNSAEDVAAIMESANAAVTGTAFGLDEAATTAASAVAAGIEPGKDLQRTLTLMGDAATIAGTDMSTMGSIVNKVATSDLMQMDVANQLMDAGIPILQMVADEMGVTADEARKMASEGEVSFEIFQNALENGLGGAALESGDTFRGALANAGAAMGRFGATLAAPVFDNAPVVFGAIGDAFGLLQEKVGPLAEQFGEWLAPKVEEFAENLGPWLVDRVESFATSIGALAGWLQDNAVWLKPVVAGLGAMAGVIAGVAVAMSGWNKAQAIYTTVTKVATGQTLLFNNALKTNVIILVVSALAALVAGLVYFFRETETGQKIWETFTTALADGWDWVVEKFTAGVDWIKGKWGEFTALFTGDGMFAGIGDALGNVVEIFQNTFGTIKDNLVDWASGTWSAVKGVFAFVTGDFDGMKGHFSDAFDSVKDIASRTWDTVKENFSLAWENVTVAAPKMWDEVKEQAGNAWDSVTSTVSEKTSDLWDDVKDGARGAFDWASDNEITGPAVGAITAIGEGIGEKWGEFNEKVQPLKDSVSDLWGTLTGNGEGPQEGEERGGIAGFVDSFTKKVGELQEKLQPAKDAVKSVWDALNGRGEGGEVSAEESGGIAGMVETITEKITELRDNVQPIIDKFKDKFNELREAVQPLLDKMAEKTGDLAKKIGGATLVIAVGLLLSPFILMAGVIYVAVTALVEIANAFEWVSEKWTEMKDWLSTTWEELKSNVFDAFEDAIQSVSDKFTEVKDWITEKWDELVANLERGWGWIDENVIIPFQDGLQDLENRARDVVDWVSSKWSELVANLERGWAWIDQNVLQPFKDGLSSLWNDYVLPIIDWIKSKWDELVAKLEAGWKWIDRNVFAPLGRGLETVQGWFEAAVDGIGTIWDGLRAAAAKPVKFVIDTVWNKGILAAWNSIADFLPGIDTRDAIPLGDLGRYATGGVLPGYTPGRDVHDFYSPTGGRIHLSGGEAIMRPEWTRAVGGPAAVEAMNKAARSGRIDPNQIQTGNAHAFAGGGVWDLGRFASGGVLITTAIQSAMRDIVKAKYPNISLTSATRPGHSGYHGTGQATDWSNGFGNTPMQLALAHDIAQTYPGSAQLIYAAPGWAGNIYEGSPAGAMDSGVYKTAQAGRHDNHVHWAMTQAPTMQFGGGVFEGGNNGGGLGAAVFNWIADRARGVWDRLVEPIRGMLPEVDNDFARIPGAALEELASKAWNFISGLFGAGGGANSGSVDTSNVPADLVGAVETVFARHGFTGAEWEAAKWIIQKESNWNPTTVNPSSGAYGLFQFNPMGGNTLGAYLPDRSPDPAVQADAGARYMKDRYGSPSAAKAFWEQNQWYADGGITQFLTRDFGGLVPSGALVRNTSGRDELMLPPETTALMNRFFREFPEVAVALTEAMEAVEQASVTFSKAMDFTSMEGITARQTTRAVLGMGLDLPGADLISGVLDAEQTLWDGRVRHIGHLTDIEDKQKALEEAQQRLLDLQGASTELTTQQQRKLDDAQKALDEAKADEAKADTDDKRAKAAEKVADREEKLSRVREDLAEEGVKSEEKRAEEVQKAQDDIMAAETDLYEARKSQIMDLDHIVVLSQENVADWGAQANQLGGQLVSMGVSASMVSQGLGAVSGALGAVSAAAGPAGITLGMAFQALQIVIQLVQIIDGLIKEWLAGIAQVKIAQLDAMNDYLGNISQVTSVIHDQRSAVVELASTVVSAFIRMGDAARGMSAAAAGVFQAGLDGAKNVADIQKQILDLRGQLSGGGESSAPVPWDMGLMYDSYSNELTASPKVKTSSQSTSLRDVVAEIAALNWDLQAALIDQQIMVKQAQIDQIRAEFEVLRSRLNLDRAFADLIQGVQRLETLERIQVELAITEQQARIQQEINQLLIANAQAEQVRNDPLNRIGSFLDFDKDGKVFGIFDNMGSKAVQASESSIRANEKQIEALGKIMEQYGGSPNVSAEAIKAAEDIAYFMKEGREDLAEMAKNGSPLGDAVRATQLTTLMQDLWAIDDRNESSRRALEDLGLDFEEYLATEPLQQEIDRLTHEREAYTAQAELMRASSEDVKLAAAALRDFHREAAAREPQVVTVNVPASGQTIDADDLAATISGLGADISGLDFRVSRVESMNAPKGQAVISRKR